MLFGKKGSCLYVMLVVCIFNGYVFGESEYKAGVAEQVITPDTAIWMSGYASRDKPSQGTLHDLHAKAFAIEDRQGNRVVLISADIIGLSADMSNRIADRIKEKTGLDRSSIMFAASHTHSGPVLRSNLETMYDLPEGEWDKITKFTKDLEDCMVELVSKAIKQMQPVTLYRGNGSAGFAVNRRQYTSTGVSIGVNPIGPVDHDVPVMKAVNGEGKVIAIVFGYACHNTTLSIFEINGDYAGFAQSNLEEHWPDAVALFFSGCGADQNPNPRREIAHAKAHGRELSVAVEKVLRSPMQKIEGEIASEFRTADLPLTPAPSKQQLQEQANDKNVYITRRAKELLVKLEKDGSLPETYPYSVQTWRIGDDFQWIALAGEVVVDYSLLFKHLYGKQNTWVTGYANDVFAYIPSLRVLREGGYESFDSMIYYGLHGPWKEDIESLIVKTVAEMIADKKGE